MPHTPKRHAELLQFEASLKIKTIKELGQIMWENRDAEYNLAYKELRDRKQKHLPRWLSEWYAEFKKE
jgi:hypothetical protein